MIATRNCESVVIGMNAGYREESRSYPSFAFVHEGCYKSVIKAGGTPVLLPPAEEVIDNYLSLVHGVIVVGEPDLEFSQSHKHDFDAKLMRRIVDRRIPVLAIGSGMQLLNIELGGTIHDIESSMLETLDHWGHAEESHSHPIVTQNDSCVAASLRIIDKHQKRSTGTAYTIRANGCHKKAICGLGDGMVATAHSRDGVIEAIERIDMQEWFAMGVQFHPAGRNAPLQQWRLIENFIQGSRTRQMAA